MKLTIGLVKITSISGSQVHSQDLGLTAEKDSASFHIRMIPAEMVIRNVEKKNGKKTWSSSWKKETR